jgi:hypothetical protein
LSPERIIEKSDNLVSPCVLITDIRIAQDLHIVQESNTILSTKGLQKIEHPGSISASTN